MKTFLGLPKAEMKLAIAGVLVLAAISPAAFSAVPVDGPEYVLENASIRLVLKDNRIVSLLDKERSIEHVAPQADSKAGMFNLQLVKGIEPAVDLDATQMTSPVVHQAPGVLEMTFTHAEATVRITIRLSSSQAEVAWSISVVPASGALVVGSAACPVFETPVSSNGSVKSCLLPLYEGRLHPLNVNIVAHKPKVYPATLFSQMVACLGLKGGFLLWTDDPAGHFKEFDYKATGTVARFAVIHRMPYAPGKWQAAYQSRISFCGPSWYDAAGIYRDWALQQYWCATKLKERTDVPAFLHHPFYCFNEAMVPWPGQTQNLDTLPDRLAEIGQRLRVPVVVRAVRWEKHGGWVGIDYFPPAIGEARLRSLASQLKARQIPLIIELSGYRWQSGEDSTVLDKTNQLTPRQKDALKRYFKENNGPKVCEQQRDGQLNPTTTICRGSPFGKSFMPDMAARLFDLGATGFHGDQDSGPTPDGVTGCFNPDHGHPIPCGPWSIENTRHAYREIRAEAARRGITDFLLTKEHCTELLNMEIHGYLARMEWTYSQPHVVPLSQFLYHEFLPVVLDPSTDGLADQIIFGVIAASRDATSPLFAEYCRTMQAHAKDFLLYGRMLKPLIAEVPVSRKPATGKAFFEGKRSVTAEISIPLIRHSAWDDGAGSIGVFAINTQQKEMTVKVPVPGKGKWQATLYLGALPQQTQAVTAGETLEWPLAPGRLAAIVFKPESSR
jgi:hypothetical protein